MSYIVFTGPAKVDGTRITRNYLIEIAEENGYTVQNAVTFRTSLVVASSPHFKNRQGKKLKAADELGIPVISPNEFIEMVSHG